MSSPSDVLKLLQDALDAQPTIVGQPNDDDLLALKEKLLNVLQTITYYDRVMLDSGKCEDCLQRS